MTDLVREVLAACPGDRLPAGLLPGGRAPEYIALRGRGRGRKANVVVLAAGVPALVLKTALPEGLSDLQAEHRALSVLEQHEQLIGRLPRSLGVLEVAGRHVLVQTALDGVPMTAVVRSALHPRAALARSVAASCGWLTDFQAATRTSRTSPLASLAALERHLPALTGTLRTEQRAAVDRLARDAARFDGLPVPVTSRHGDLWPGNVLVRGRAVGVVDWEHYRDASDPLRDLWFLLLTCAHAYPWPARGRPGPDGAGVRAFVERGWFSALARQAVHAQLRALGLPEDAAAVLVFTSMAELADAQDATDAPVGPAGTRWPDLAQALLRSGGGELAAR